jgi:DNA polymerase-3 subunit gamma/tau
VIAQCGEGSVRDSLSALDQCIASYGNDLQEQDVRDLLGLFSLDSLGEVTTALTAADSRRMLELVRDLEQNGRNLQHFCRELARYFRNLLVAKLVGAGSRLIAASGSAQKQLVDTAQGFSEEDLTRFLQLTLELYKELQYSLQPRLHLELGLLRMIHAGRIVRIEEALSELSGGPPAVPSAAPPPAKPSPVSAVQARAAEAPRPVPAAPGSLKQRLATYLTENSGAVLADAVEHSEVEETPAEIRFTGPREFTLSFRDSGMRDAVQKVVGRAVKITFTGVDTPTAAFAPGTAGSDDAAQRALSHPEVQRFQEMFPGAQVRAVRNLRER